MVSFSGNRFVPFSLFFGKSNRNQALHAKRVGTNEFKAIVGFMRNIFTVFPTMK